MDRTKSKLVLVLSILFAILPFMGVSSISQRDLDAIYGNYIFYEPSANELCEISLGSVSLPTEMDQRWRELLPEAAEEEGADLGILATVLWLENGRHWPDPDMEWPVSRGDAKGPFQFLDGTWASAGRDGDNDGVKDVNNIADASYGAANFIQNLGGVEGISLGSLDDSDFEEIDSKVEKKTVARILKSYNAGGATWRDSSGLWVRKIDGVAKPWDDRKQGEINAYIEDGIEAYKEMSGVPPGYDNCLYGFGVSFNGELVFPLLTDKKTIRQGDQGGIWCYGNPDNCHGVRGGDWYPAEDIHAPEGTLVVAAAGGTVVGQGNSTDNPDKWWMRIAGEDGNTYRYIHLQEGSFLVADNDTVAAGQPIAKVGDRASADNTAPHLHFDLFKTGTVTQSIYRKCVAKDNGKSEWRGESLDDIKPCPQWRLLIDVHKVLLEEFEQMPEVRNGGTI